MKKSTIIDLPNDIRAVIPEAERKHWILRSIDLAERGEFHDFRTKMYLDPKGQAVLHLAKAKDCRLNPIIQAIEDGDYDESPDEVDKANMKKDWLENGGTEESFKALFPNH